MLTMTTAACNSSKNSGVASEIPAGYTRGTVCDMNGLDGCGFMICLDDSSRLEAVNLPDSLKKAGLRVAFTFKPFDGMSVCMSGKMVTLTDIRKTER